MATIWTEKVVQRRLFWISAAWFFCGFAVAAWKREPLGFRLPRWRITVAIIGLAALLALALSLTAAAMGTLHGLFGINRPLRHAAGYVFWCVVQQFIQQSYFFVRLERITGSGRAAVLITALLVGAAHLPNPVLTPVTLIGACMLSELFRRYHSFVPLGIAQGLIGLAIAISVPDGVLHHMRVGLGYLRYPH